MVIVRRVVRWFDRWKITILFVGLAFVALAVYRVNDTQNHRRVESACKAVTQVRDAALKLTKPASVAGVTDPATRERIRQVNVQRAKAREQLRRDLSC
jgi:hypothetical protein